MNPFRWSREQQVAGLVVCLLGAAFGLFIGFFTVARSSLPAGALFKVWIQRPDLYWPCPAFGAVIAALTFYATRMIRQPHANATSAKARADAFYPVIARAIGQLSENTREARQAMYDRARTTLRAQLGEQSNSFMQDSHALEFAIRKLEKESLRSETTKIRAAKISLRDPRHYPTTAYLVISIFFPRLWILDFTSMSLYWVARLPKDKTTAS
jgi:hypothetical protein